MRLRNTLRKVQKIRVILERSENKFSILQWVSLRKQNLKHEKIKKTYDQFYVNVQKLIFHHEHESYIGVTKTGLTRMIVMKIHELL